MKMKILNNANCFLKKKVEDFWLVPELTCLINLSNIINLFTINLFLLTLFYTWNICDKFTIYIQFYATLLINWFRASFKFTKLQTNRNKRF